MTVQELIDELQKVEDKNKRVAIAVYKLGINEIKGIDKEGFDATVYIDGEKK